MHRLARRAIELGQRFDLLVGYNGIGQLLVEPGTFFLCIIREVILEPFYVVLFILLYPL